MLQQRELTFSKSLFGIFFPLSFLRNSWPNFWRLEKAHSAASSVPSTSSSLSPYIAMLKLNPGDGSAATSREAVNKAKSLIGPNNDEGMEE